MLSSERGLQGCIGINILPNTSATYLKIESLESLAAPKLNAHLAVNLEPGFAVPKIYLTPDTRVKGRHFSKRGICSPRRIPTLFDRVPTRSPWYEMWRYPSTYPSTDEASAPYPGTYPYPRSQINRVANLALNNTNKPTST
eukprot:scaffold54060_cov32-Cyclotella_meneghiniana.AAC.5